MKKFPNVQSALVAAVGLVVGLGLDHVVGGRPFKIMVLAIGLSFCFLFLFLPRTWTGDWKIMRAVSILSLIVLLLSLFDGSVIGCISWVSIGFWGMIFVYSFYRWWVLRSAKRRIL